MNPADLGAALRAFVDALGGDHRSWRAHEQPTHLTYADVRLPRERAIGLRIDVLQAMVEAYGDALACAFHDGDDLLLRVDSTIDGGSLARLADQSRGLDEVTLQFRLDKARLAKAWYSVPAGCHAVVYFYPDAFDALLRASPFVVEECLWDDNPTGKVVVVLPARSVFLDGPALAVVGGDHVAQLSEVVAPDRGEIERLVKIYAAAGDYLHWRRQWVRFLTPRHLDLQGIDDDGTIRGALRRHAARLFVLFTADKSVDSDAGLLCTYSSPEFSVDVIVPEVLDCRSVSDGSALGIQQVLDWVYEAPLSTKRLSIAQLVFARHLHFADSDRRFERLIDVSQRARDELVWTEKTVMTEALRTYAADVRSLEDYVDKTVQGFSEQVSAVVKSFTDTMLAGLGTIVVGLLATLIKEGPGSMVFGVALLAYALYVLFFQIMYSLANYRDRESALAKDFDYRRERFKERIFGHNVDRIIGDRLTNARRLFQKWMRRALVVSWLVVALGAAAGLSVIGANVATRSASVPAIEPTPTAAVSPTVGPGAAGLPLGTPTSQVGGAPRP